MNFHVDFFMRVTPMKTKKINKSELTAFHGKVTLPHQQQQTKENSKTICHPSNRSCGFSCLSANASTEYFLYLFPICLRRRQRSDSCTVAGAPNGYASECRMWTWTIVRCYFFVHHCIAMRIFRSAHRNWCCRLRDRCQHRSL